MNENETMRLTIMHYTHLKRNFSFVCDDFKVEVTVLSGQYIDHLYNINILSFC